MNIKSNVIDLDAPHKAVDELEPLYFLNEHNIDKEVFGPVFDFSTCAYCMMGYFTSRSLSELAFSLSNFLRNSQTNIRLIVSPHLENEDLHAIRKALNANENLLDYLFPGFEISEDSLRTRCVIALAYLVATKRIEFKIALQTKGLFHTKCWLFRTKLGWMTIHGSGNMTAGGLSVNTEQISVDREWDDDRSKKVVTKIQSTFVKLWENSFLGVNTIKLNSSTIKYLCEVSNANRNVNNWKNFIDEKLHHNNEDSASLLSSQNLEIPLWLNYNQGTYSHQGEAATAWLKERKGILSIATGGGKTLTSLVIATKLVRKLDRLVVVVAVPTKTLLKQWSDTIRKFNVEPLNSEGLPSNILKRRIKERIRNVQRNVSKSELVVVTHDALKQNLIEFIENTKIDIPMMLIGDEVHNLGSEGFRIRSKAVFDFYLGLSATYERQFDEEGTKFLRDYFGNVVYEFTTSDAIGKCLVPFEYHVHTVELDDDEKDEWCDLSYQIRKLSYASEFPDGDSRKERWKSLCLRRRRIVESTKGKLAVFSKILPKDRNEIRRTLVFCTDKNPEQLDDVNSILAARSINFHQVTQEETKNSYMLDQVISAFSNGKLQVLTSKRVLDEGFDAPQTENAYLLASHTVRRQWVQRLGRILRLSEATAKTKAHIHDFVVLPYQKAEGRDTDLSSLVRSELERMLYFSSLSQNGLESGGAMELINELNFYAEN